MRNGWQRSVHHGSWKRHPKCRASVTRWLDGDNKKFGEASRQHKSGSLNSCTSSATGVMQMTRLEKPSVENLTTIFRFCKVSLGNCRALVVEKEKTERKSRKKISPSSPSGPKRIRRLFFWLDSLFLFSLFCNDIRASLTASIDSHKSCFLWLLSALFSACFGSTTTGSCRLPWDSTGGRRLPPTRRQQSNKSSRRLHGRYQRDNQGPRISPSAALSDSGWRSRWSRRDFSEEEAVECLSLSLTKCT